MPLGIFILFKHFCGKISVARVGEENHDVFAAVFFSFCNFCRGMESRARRNTNEDALRFCDKSAFFKSILRFHGDYLIKNSCVEYSGDKVCADALYLVRARNAF